MKLKDRIVQYRAEHNLSMKEFAEITGVTYMTISNIERGIQSPSRLTKGKIELVIGSEEDEIEHFKN